MKYVHKPTVIEAIQFIGGTSYETMCDIWGEHFKECVHLEQSLFGQHLRFLYRGLEMKCFIRGWMVRGACSSFYTISNESFKLLYEKAGLK